MERSPVFAETYRRYLEEIRSIDFLARADILGVSRKDSKLLIPLYDRRYTFTAEGIVEDDGRLSPAVRVLICKYILCCPERLPPSEGELVAYRQFKDAAPLVSYFTTTTIKAIEAAFAGNLEALRERTLSVGGRILPTDVYDFSAEFRALPRVPVYLNFNDRDDTFPAACSILYRSSAALFLDMECLAMTGPLLTEKLILPGTAALEFD